MLYLQRLRHSTNNDLCLFVSQQMVLRANVPRKSYAKNTHESIQNIVARFANWSCAPAAQAIMSLSYRHSSFVRVPDALSAVPGAQDQNQGYRHNLCYRGRQYAHEPGMEVWRS